MSAKTSVSLPISSGNGTNEVTNISKNDKKDNQLGSVTDGEELSDAELILADTDFLCAEQALNSSEMIQRRVLTTPMSIQEEKHKKAQMLMKMNVVRNLHRVYKLNRK